MHRLITKTTEFASIQTIQNSDPRGQLIIVNVKSKMLEGINTNIVSKPILCNDLKQASNIPVG